MVSHVRRRDDDHVARLALEKLLVSREDVEVPVERSSEFDGEELRGRVGIGDGYDGEVLVAEMVEVDEMFSSHHAGTYDSVLGRHRC